MSSKQRGEERPPQAKKLKKELGRTWKTILEALAKDQQAPKEETARISRFCADYSLFTEKEWQARWQDCAEQVAVVLALMEKGDFAAARAMADKVYQLTKSCHKEYK